MRRKNIYGLTVLCFFAITALSGQATSDKGKLFIIGGGHKPAPMIERMILEANIGPHDYTVVLPMASEYPVESTEDIQDQFAEAGYTNIYGVMFEKNDLDNKAKLDSVRGAKLIFISGGDQSRFMNLIRGSDLDQVIHFAFDSGALIAGTSAGAAMMSEMMITGNQLKDTTYRATFRTIQADNIELSNGLGLLKNAIIDQHFLIRSRHNRLLSAILEFPDMRGIGIDESTAILVKGNRAEVVGLSQVLVFSNPQHSKKIVDGKYGGLGLQMDLYLPGDSFEIVPVKNR